MSDPESLGKLIQARNMFAASGKYGSFRTPLSLEDKFINQKLGEWARADSRPAKKLFLDEITNYVTHYFDLPVQGQGTGGKPARKKKTKTTVRILNDE